MQIILELAEDEVKFIASQLAHIDIDQGRGKRKQALRIQNKIVSQLMEQKREGERGGWEGYKPRKEKED